MVGLFTYIDFVQVLGRSCYNYCIYFFFISFLLLIFILFYLFFLRQYLIILPRLTLKSLLTHTGLDFVILLSYLPGSGITSLYKQDWPLILLDGLTFCTHPLRGIALLFPNLVSIS